jgi:hypothetical protein
MIEDMTLAGLAAGTQKIYVQAVRKLAAHYRRSPDQLSEEEVRGYLLGLRQRGVARGTFKTGQYGLCFLYRHTLGRPWGLFGEKRIASPRQKRLPEALSEDQVRQLLSGIRNPVHKTCLAVMYACGLRISEATTLEVSAIDRANQVLRIVGKSLPRRRPGATRSGWCRCHSRSSTNWGSCGAAIATAAGYSPIDTATRRSTSACCRISSSHPMGVPPALPGRQSEFDVCGGGPRLSIDETPPREPPKHTILEAASMDELESLNHSRWECKYHVVFIPKCRGKTLYVQLRQYLGEVFRKLAEQKESRIEEGHLMPDHVHMMISIPPKYAVSQVVGFIKGKSATWRALTVNTGGISSGRAFGRAGISYRRSAATRR